MFDYPNYCRLRFAKLLKDGQIVRATSFSGTPHRMYVWSDKEEKDFEKDDWLLSIRIMTVVDFKNGLFVTDDGLSFENAAEINPQCEYRPLFAYEIDKKCKQLNDYYLYRYHAGELIVKALIDYLNFAHNLVKTAEDENPVYVRNFCQQGWQFADGENLYTYRRELAR